MGHKIAVCDWLDAPEKIRNLENRRIAERISPDGLLAFMRERAGEIETVFHMGAISSTTETNAALINEINVTLPIQIWMWCRDNEVALIYASSAATYGDGARASTMMTPSRPYRDSSRSTCMAKAKIRLIFGWRNRWRGRLPRHRSGPGSSFSMSMGPTNITRADK